MIFDIDPPPNCPWGLLYDIVLELRVAGLHKASVVVSGQHDLYLLFFRFTSHYRDKAPTLFCRTDANHAIERRRRA